MRGEGAERADRGDTADLGERGDGALATERGDGALTAEATLRTDTGLAGETALAAVTGDGAVTEVAAEVTVTVVVVLASAVAVGETDTTGVTRPSDEPERRTTGSDAGTVADGVSSASAVPKAAPAPTAPRTPLTIQVRAFMICLPRCVARVCLRQASGTFVRCRGDDDERSLIWCWPHDATSVGGVTFITRCDGSLLIFVREPRGPCEDLVRNRYLAVTFGKLPA